MLFYSYVLSFFFFKQKTAYEIRISDWSSDVCSSDLVQQVLINLIRNSVQAMMGEPRREIRISTSLSSGDMVEVSVADTGVGLSRDIREALFSPFRSTKAEGMGIGLSIRRTIVEAHGGRIWAEDRDGGGAIVRFTLPLAEEG